MTRSIPAVVILGVLAASAAYPAELAVKPAAKISAKEAFNGAFFVLPKTIITVDATLEMKAVEPGPYAKFAPIFFPSDAAKSLGPSKGQSVSLTSATLGSRGAPDQDRVFWVDTKSKVFLNRTAGLQLTENGTVTNLSGGADNTFPDFLLGVVGAISGFASRSFLLGGATAEGPKGCVEALAPEQAMAQILFTALEKDSRRLWLADFAAAERAKPEFKEKIAELFTELLRQCTGGYSLLENEDFEEALTSFQSYKTASGALTAIAQATSTEIAQSVNLTDYINAKAAAMKQYKELFIGQVTPFVWATRFEVGDLSATAVPLLRIDRATGKFCIPDIARWKGTQTPPTRFMHDENNLSNCPPVAQGGTASTVRDVTLEAIERQQAVAAILNTNLPLFDMSSSKAQGFPYIIPEIAEWLVKYGSQVAGRARLVVAQNGKLAALPKSLGGRNTKLALAYYEASGALKSLDGTGTGNLSKATADSLSSSVNTSLDAYNKAQTEAATTNSALARREQERKMLEEEFKIQDYCAKLGRTGCEVPR